MPQVEKVKCRKCRRAKLLTEFDKVARLGPLEAWNIRHCKKCVHKAYLARRANPAKRGAMEEASRNWKRQNPERHAELNQAYRARYPEKVIAQNRLGYAVRSGAVVKLPCEICGTTDRVHGHHRTYRPEDWYNVTWLCYVCHKLKHMKSRKRG